MKKYSVAFVLAEIAVMLVISCIPTVFVALYTDPEKNLTIPALIVFMFFSFILHTALANKILFPLARKTMEKKSAEEGLVLSQIFYNRQSNSCASVLAIDEARFRIAYVSVHNPFNLQTADVKELTDVKADYVKGPMFDATRYVYYQFTYKGKMIKIPTFTARNMHYLSAKIVQEKLAEAKRFSGTVEGLQKKRKAMENHNLVMMSEYDAYQVINRVNGIIPEDKVLKDMKDFFREEFSVEILDYLVDRLKDGLLRARFMVWGGNAQRPFLACPDREKENKIKERFSRACREHGLNKAYFDTSAYFAVVSDLKPEIEALYMTPENVKKIPEVLKKYPEVKKHRISIPTVFVFYATDKDIDINYDNGLSQKISQDISDIFTPVKGIKDSGSADVRFSSLETFEGKYKGNFHGFWLDH